MKGFIANHVIWSHIWNHLISIDPTYICWYFIVCALIINLFGSKKMYSKQLGNNLAFILRTPSTPTPRLPSLPPFHPLPFLLFPKSMRCSEHSTSNYFWFYNLPTFLPTNLESGCSVTQKFKKRKKTRKNKNPNHLEYVYTVYLFLKQDTFIQKWQNSTDIQRLGLAILIQITQTCDQMSPTLWPYTTT